MRVLLIRSQQSFLIDALAARLRRHGVALDRLYLFDRSLETADGRELLRSSRLDRFLGGLPGFHLGYKRLRAPLTLLEIPDRYELAHLHFAGAYYRPYLPLIRRLAKRLAVSVWGSDLYQAGRLERSFKQGLFRAADALTFSNPEMRDDFLGVYPDTPEEKIHLCRFGLAILEEVRRLREAESRREWRRALDLPVEARIVVCGHGALPVVQHDKILAALHGVQDRLPPGCVFVFPLTYGWSDTRARVREALRGSRLAYRTFEEPLSDADVARLRLAADVMINVHKSDALSGAMQEHLFAGSVVVAGRWLPYRVLEERGAYLVRVDDIGSLGATLVSVLENLDEHRVASRRNAEVIWRLSGWEHVIDSWLALYRKLLGDGAAQPS